MVNFVTLVLVPGILPGMLPTEDPRNEWHEGQYFVCRGTGSKPALEMLPIQMMQAGLEHALTEAAFHFVSFQA